KWLRVLGSVDFASLRVFGSIGNFVHLPLFALSARHSKRHATHWSRYFKASGIPFALTLMEAGFSRSDSISALDRRPLFPCCSAFDKILSIDVSVFLPGSFAIRLPGKFHFLVGVKVYNRRALPLSGRLGRRGRCL